MIELLQQYSIVEILAILIALAMGIKGFFSFWDWAVAKLKKIFNKERKQEEDKQDVEDKLSCHEEKMKNLMDGQIALNEKLEHLMDKVNLLIASDRDDIKSWITEKHHYYCYSQEWIDDYSLDCCEKRYAHYKAEKGNSFIEGFMEELRALPKKPNIKE